MSRLRVNWIYLFVFLSWTIWLSGIFGNTGILQAYRLSQARRDLALRVNALDFERQKLRGSLAALQQNPEIQEAAIRESLGFVRDNELVFEFKSENKSAQSASQH